MMKENPTVFLGHGFVRGVCFASGKSFETRSAKVVLPSRCWRENVAPDPIEIDNTRSKWRKPCGQFRTAGGTQRNSGVGIFESYAFRQKPVDIGRLDF